MAVITTMAIGKVAHGVANKAPLETGFTYTLAGTFGRRVTKRLPHLLPEASLMI